MLRGAFALKKKIVVFVWVVAGRAIGSMVDVDAVLSVSQRVKVIDPFDYKQSEWEGGREECGLEEVPVDGVEDSGVPAKVVAEVFLCCL